jgi:hypothetical protein
MPCNHLTIIYLFTPFFPHVGYHGGEKNLAKEKRFSK